MSVERSGEPVCDPVIAVLGGAVRVYEPALLLQCVYDASRLYCQSSRFTIHIISIHSKCGGENTKSFSHKPKAFDIMQIKLTGSAADSGRLD